MDLKYPCIGSKRDHKDRYNRDHRVRDDRNRERPRNEPTNSRPDKGPIYFTYNKPGHYATSCPDQKGISTKAKIQLAQ